MTFRFVVLILAATIARAQAPPERSANATTPNVDTTIAVTAATKLRVDAAAGRITVRVWDQNVVHIVATPRAGTTVFVDASSALLQVWAGAGRRIAEAEFVVTVPRRMALTLGSGDMTIDVTGSEGEIVAKNHSGDITIEGGRGSVALKSVLGAITLRGATGRITAQTMHAVVRLTDVVGDVDVESSSNHLYLTRVDSRALTASTIGGVIWFTGPLRDDGRYAFTTHSGSIFLTLVDPVNATVSVSTVSGGFANAFPSTRQESGRRGRFSVKIGTGAATVDAETFTGGIVIKRP